MQLSDLREDIQQQLLAERTTLCSKWKVNTPYQVCFTNAEDTRYFTAVRRQLSWNDDKGNYMPFGGGSVWHITYGKILWSRTKKPMGGFDYIWVRSNKTFGKSANGTEIPKTLATKAEVMQLLDR